MKKYLYAILLVMLLLLLAIPSEANTYFLAPATMGGNDSNPGTSIVLPWLTPNHSLNCGDEVIAASSAAYVATNFRPGQWGVVTCPAGNNVAWLKCAAFDTCKININSTGHNAMTPTRSYWGVQGWEITASVLSGNQCFEAFPPDFTHTIHHIIFANNIANGCGDGAFTTGASANGVGVDYTVIVGNISYNAAQDNANCYSGIDIVAPVNSDVLPGTHYYIAGNFSWGNVDPSPCAGGFPSDGHGISLDSLDANKYTGQIVIKDNISVFNGGTGIQSFNSTSGAKIFILQNTTGFDQTAGINAFPCADINLSNSLSTWVYKNLSEAGMALACSVGGSPQDYFVMSATDPSDRLFDDWIFSVAGNNITGSGTVGPFNVTSSNPNFKNPFNPGVPKCSGFQNVVECMQFVAEGYTPTTMEALPYGYQKPHHHDVYDPLFPKWVCGVTNFPQGLITRGCD